MTSTQIGLLIAIVVLVGIAAAGGWLWWRSRSLRTRFGPEYDRVVSEQDSRISAERELRERERRHAGLELRPLDDEARARYAQAWERVQAQFIDDPAAAVVAGDDLVTRLVSDRGYPTQDFDEQAAYLSVEHATTLGHYRDAHDIFVRNERGEASTEELRQALVHYRALFADILGFEPESTAATAGSETSTQWNNEPSGLPYNGNGATGNGAPGNGATGPESTTERAAEPAYRNQHGGV